MPTGERSGRVLFDGVVLADLGEREQASCIGFVMQDVDAQIVADTVAGELAFGMECAGMEPQAMRARVAELCAFFGMQGFSGARVGELSGGQKQLLCLASAVALEPELVVLDEPSSQLDPVAARHLLDALVRMNRELGTTVLVAEQRSEELFSRADALAVMDAGRIVAHGAPRELASSLGAGRFARLLPTSARVWAAVAGVRADAEEIAGEEEDGACHARCVPESAGEGERGRAAVPLSVREGRAWLADWARGRELPVRSVPADAAPAGADARRRRGGAAEFAVRVRDLAVRYAKDGPDVLGGLDLEVPAGSFFAIVGANGVGKSTLLSALAGLLKPWRGRIELFGRRLSARGRDGLYRGTLAYLPQDPTELFVAETVRAELAEMFDDGWPAAHGMRAAAGGDAQAGEGRVDELACRCGLESLLDAHPLDLSAGQRQRVGLAKALACGPRLLLLDEPTKGLDPFTQDGFADFLHTLRAAGTTVVAASHDLEFLARHATHVALLADGWVASCGPARELLAQSAFYTTAASRMSRHVFEGAVTDEEVAALCLQKI